MADMTLEQYTNAIKKAFPKGNKPQSDVDAFFNEKETKDYIKEAYDYRDDKLMGMSIESVANSLDMIY